jgi:16S rRNA (cytidine1402-2'-O)-methyltransferase
MLFLFPTFLSENQKVLSEEELEVVRSLDEFIVEDEKSARKFLKQVGTIIPQDKLILHLLNEHSSEKDISSLLSVIKKPKNIGLLSEAGCPAVADPGAAVVKMAHENNILVKPFTGPSSILLALMSSGMNGQSFVFHGYLPRESAERKNVLAKLEKDAIVKKQTQIFMETPYRNAAMVKDILSVCKDSTLLCIACDLTSSTEYIKTKTVGSWKKQVPAIEKRPCIFIIGV